MENKSSKELEKIESEANIIAKMSGKERYEYYKSLQAKRKQSIKLMKMLIKDKNRSIMLSSPDEANKLIGELNEVENELVSTKRNKYNSSFYEWHPSTQLNRAARRQKQNV